MKKFRVLAVICITVMHALAGPNENAKIMVDLDYQTQEIDSVAQLSGTSIIVAIRASDVVNLDSYEFFLRFNPVVLSYKAGQAEIMGENENIFRKNSSDEILFSCGFEQGHTDLLTVSNTLTSELDSVAAPDGDGLLALIMFDIISMASCILWVEDARFCDYEGDVNCEAVTRYTNGALEYDVTPVRNPSYTVRTAGRDNRFAHEIFDIRGRAVHRRNSAKTVSPANGMYVRTLMDQKCPRGIVITEFK
ncbi:MAG: hypothetical protein GF350_13330 [Chitinivibrionales bacterium]|nr:hypothetical protein [Chitinivibrionales bacterium]